MNLKWEILDLNPGLISFLLAMTWASYFTSFRFYFLIHKMCIIILASVRIFSDLKTCEKIHKMQHSKCSKNRNNFSSVMM